MPGSTTLKPVLQYHCSNQVSKFYIVYVLESLKDKKRYIGLTTNLRKRVKEHNLGKSFSTKFSKPFKLIYAKLCLNFEDAKRRERYLKTTNGRRFLAKRLQNYYN